MENEINIIVAHKDDKVEILAAFTDRGIALDWYKRLKSQWVAVSLHSVEINTGKELLIEFDID